MELGSIPTRTADEKPELGLRMVTWFVALEVIKKLSAMGSNTTPCGKTIVPLLRVVVLVLKSTTLALLLLLSATTATFFLGSMATPVGPCSTPIVAGVWAEVDTGKVSTRLAPLAVITALPVP